MVKQLINYICTDACWVNRVVTTAIFQFEREKYTNPTHVCRFDLTASDKLMCDAFCYFYRKLQ